MSNVVLTGLARDLARRADEGNPVRIGVIGSGEMGTDLVTQGMLMKGVSVCAVSTRRPHTVLEAARHRLWRRGDGARGRNAVAGDRGHRGRPDRHHLRRDHGQNPLIDVVIDATGKPGVAADFDLLAMEHGKHVVMMNVEADVTIGPYLKGEADRLGVIYSVGAGDEPSSCMELIEFASALGYTIVSAGKGKNNPLNHDAVPDDYRRGGHAAQHEPAHAGRVRRRLQDHGRDVRHRQRHRPGARHARHARPERRPRRHRQGADPARGRRHPQPQGRGRLHHRQGRGARRLRRRRGRASAHHRAHGRPACRPRALLLLLPALSPDLAGSAADGGAHHALRQGRHGAAAASGGRSLRGRQARPEARRGARCHRRDLLPLLHHDGWRTRARRVPCRSGCWKAAR